VWPENVKTNHAELNLVLECRMRFAMQVLRGDFDVPLMRGDFDE
jgi:hypothetical protein